MGVTLRIMVELTTHSGQVDRYNTLLDELTKTIAEIHKTFTVQDAPRQLQLPNAMMKQMNTDIKMTSLTTLPAMELMFADAQERIEHLLSDDIYPRFVKHQMTTSATRALAEGRGKYAGLGDCFCLTNPKSVWLLPLAPAWLQAPAMIMIEFLY